MRIALSLGAVSEVAVSARDVDEVATPSIIGGIETPAGDYPWMGALVQIDAEDLAKAQFCGCSLIDEQWILTAAHCLDGERAGEIAVAFGDGDLEGANIVVPIDLIVMHPEYFDVINLNNDLALARLVRPVEGVEPIELNKAADQVDTGSPVRVIGWGLTDILQNDPAYASQLQQADLSILDRDWVNSEDALNGGVSDLMLPIGTLDPLVTSSFGDSGGPMITLEGAEPRLAGVTSWGTGCFTSFLPYSVYTDVIPYLDWIEGVVNRDRIMWEDAHGASVLDRADAYRFGGNPEDADRLPFSLEGGELRTNFVTRPFSPIWKYLLSYYDFDEEMWRDFGWEFDEALAVDGSVAVPLPEEVGEDAFIIRSQQVARSAGSSELVDLPVNQLVSGRFGTIAHLPSEDVRAFRISNLKRDWGYKIEILSEGGTVRYYLQSANGQGVDDQSGEIEGRGHVEIFDGEKGEFFLYLVAGESDVSYSVYLRQGDSGSLSVYSSNVSGSLSEENIELGESGLLAFANSLYGSPGESDVLVRVESPHDMAISILDTDTLSSAGQSNAWPTGAGEYMIFNRSTKDKAGVENLKLRLMTVNPGEFGDYSMTLDQIDEYRTLSLADEYDFRGLTVRDFTEDAFDGHAYVDRLELTNLGAGKRFVEFIGFESFRPLFAVRSITDDVVVKQFDRAFCYETSVIEFTAVAGKRYEVIVAGGERYLNKNYFLEFSTTRPPDPYERFATSFSEGDSKMVKWLRRRGLEPSEKEVVK